MTLEPDPEAAEAALLLFADWIARRGSGDGVEFASLLRSHPDLAAELDRLHAEWSRMLEAGASAERSIPSGSIHERILERFGDAAVSKVSLHGTGSEAPGSAFAAARILRLAARSGSFGRYAIEGEIARGGMGAILRVWDADLRRHLAMKVVLDEAGATAAGAPPLVRPRTLARFLEEAQVTGQLDHPGIVPVHELGLDAEGRVYFTMKLVQGRDLQEIFGLVFDGREGWTETRALSVVLKVCEAIGYAHEKGVIHRDLKPANVMVGNFGEVFVMDWGLARILGQEDAHDPRVAPGTFERGTRIESDRREESEKAPDSPLVTMEGDVVGTPAYMPPEQARGRTETLSARSDVYSIGAMLYHLLARQMPYAAPGHAMTHHAVLARVLAGPPRPLHELNKSVPAELGAICEKAMARDPLERYADTLAVAEDLRAFLEHRVVGAYETGAVAELRKWVVRNRPLALAIAAGILILFVGIVFSAEKAREAEAARLETAGKERLATQRAEDVLSLSAIQDLKTLEARADELWPPSPESLPKYEAWLRDARELVDGRPADEANGIKRKPSLVEHEAKLAELRSRARPRTAQQVEADRKASPRLAEREPLRARLTWQRRMLGEEPWPSEAEAEAEVEKANPPSDPAGMNQLAWGFVDPNPNKAVFGHEMEGRVLVRRALAAAKESERATCLDTLAWALFRTGRLDEAQVEEERSLAEGDEAEKPRRSELREQLLAAVAEWREPAARAKRAEEAKASSARLVELEASLEERRTWEFDDSGDGWWHAQLVQLVDGLRAFRDETTGLASAGISETHGWGIPKRAEFARTIEERSVTGAEARKRWDETIAGIATSEVYRGLALKPQVGLLPIGADPDTHLWEFAHVQSGEPARRGADGKLVLEEPMGIVLVLVPGGTFRMGSQAKDPGAANYDPMSRPDETPVQTVTLDPYFLSKYEMTQGQWSRCTGGEPSYFTRATWEKGWSAARKPWSGLLPVEQVSWFDCAEAMRRMGLALPTEAQWENGCRGGTGSVYWSGDSVEGVAGTGNLADTYAKTHGGSGFDPIEPWDDGNTTLAEIGSYRANGFGLHDVIGNLYEWCSDWYTVSLGQHPPRPGDGERQVADSRVHVFRGAAYDYSAAHARSAARSGAPPGQRSTVIGVRPAMAILSR